MYALLRSRMGRGLMLALVFVIAIVGAVHAAGGSQTRVWVEFRPGARAAAAQALQAAGAEFHYSFDRIHAFVVTVPQAALEGLQRNPNIVAIEEDVPRYRLSAPAAGVAAPTTANNGQTMPSGVDTV